MTLDEAIKRCESEAKHNLKSAEKYHHKGESRLEDALRYDAKYKQQLAEWLKELKALQEDDDVKDIFKNCDTCKYIYLKFDDYPCDRCTHRYINQYQSND